MNPFANFKQKTDYDCGVSACRFLLALHAVNMDWIVKTPEKFSGTKKDTGTSHEGIKLLLEACYVKVKENSVVLCFRNTPFIANVTLEDNIGHYVVVTATTNNCVTFFDPEYGEIRTMEKNTFKDKWYSHSSGEFPPVHSDFWKIRII